MEGAWRNEARQIQPRTDQRYLRGTRDRDGNDGGRFLRQWIRQATFYNIVTNSSGLRCMRPSGLRCMRPQAAPVGERKRLSEPDWCHLA